jgi:stage V sporulation protein G
MEITDVKIIPVDDEKLKAFVSIVLDNCFVVTDIKVIHGPKGLFVSMPSKKRKDGTFKDIAHPLNNQTRQYLEERVLSVYRQQVEQKSPQQAAPAPVEGDAAAPADFGSRIRRFESFRPSHTPRRESGVRRARNAWDRKSRESAPIRAPDPKTVG